jgi:hypothetical protein
LVAWAGRMGMSVLECPRLETRLWLGVDVYSVLVGDCFVVIFLGSSLERERG